MSCGRSYALMYAQQRITCRLGMYSSQLLLMHVHQICISRFLTCGRLFYLCVMYVCFRCCMQVGVPTCIVINILTWYVYTIGWMDGWMDGWIDIYICIHICISVRSRVHVCTLLHPHVHMCITAVSCVFW